MIADVSAPFRQFLGEHVKVRNRVQRHAEYVQPLEIEPHNVAAHVTPPRDSYPGRLRLDPCTAQDFRSRR